MVFKIADDVNGTAPKTRLAGRLYLDEDDISVTVSR
jgi:hypothetical protein